MKAMPALCDVAVSMLLMANKLLFKEETENSHTIFASVGGIFFNDSQIVLITVYTHAISFDCCVFYSVL